MTHFTVLVKYEGTLDEADKKIEEMLAPYDENEEKSPFKEYLREEDIDSYCNNYNLPRSQDLDVSHFKDWFGEEGGKDDKGYYRWSTYNKLSKWDWYQTGGRWQGILILKNGAKGVTGELGVPNRDDVIRNTDIAYLKDLDFETMRSKQREELESSWDAFINEAKINQDPGSIMWLSDIEDDDTLETFLARKGDGTLETHAVLDEDGWHEPSRMGFWAMTLDETESEQDWNQKFFERWLSNPTENTVIAIVDCHI